jgi:hypothetical protein
VTNNTQLYRTREWSGNVNASLPTHLIGNSDELKFGIAFRRRTNTHAYNPYTSTAAPSVPLSAVTEPGMTYYYQDHYADGPNISIPASRALWANGTGAGFATNAAANSFGGLAVQQDNREDVYAGYVQEQVKFGRVSLIGGLRIEHTSAVYNGNTTVPTNSSSATTDRGGQTATYNGSTLIPVSSRASYTNFFPSIQARFEVKPDLILRAAYSSTIARPASTRSIRRPRSTPPTTSSPRAIPTSSRSPPTASICRLRNTCRMAASSRWACSTRNSNYIFGRTVFGGITDPTILGALGGQSTPTQVVTYSNISKAHARGFELNYDQHLTFLPGPLSHLGVSANYTFVDSRRRSAQGRTPCCPRPRSTITMQRSIGMTAVSTSAAPPQPWAAACSSWARPRRSTNTRKAASRRMSASAMR